MRNAKKYIRIALILAFAVVLLLQTVRQQREILDPSGEYGDIGAPGSFEEYTEDESAYSSDDLSIADIPSFSGTPVYVVNGNRPTFSSEEYEGAREEYIELSDLDRLGRCGTCEASLSKDMLATEERGDISSVHPSGWNQATYPDIIETEYLYHRSHLIAYMFSGLNAEPRNLITGTEFMNENGMLPYAERAVQNWLIRKADGGRVLYRVTPMFEGNELLCRGVHIQAGDVASEGQNFHINVFCYNTEPGIRIDYATGASWPEQ